MRNWLTEVRVENVAVVVVMAALCGRVVCILGCITVLCRCSLLLQMELHGLSVCVDREPCKNGRTDRDAIWDERTMCGMGAQMPTREGAILGE